MFRDCKTVLEAHALFQLRLFLQLPQTQNKNTEQAVVCEKLVAADLIPGRVSKAGCPMLGMTEVISEKYPGHIQSYLDMTEVDLLGTHQCMQRPPVPSFVPPKGYPPNLPLA